MQEKMRKKYRKYIAVLAEAVHMYFFNLSFFALHDLIEHTLHFLIFSIFHNISFLFVPIIFDAYSCVFLCLHHI